jgi:hypothetical protein
MELVVGCRLVEAELLWEEVVLLQTCWLPPFVDVHLAAQQLFELDCKSVLVQSHESYLLQLLGSSQPVSLKLVHSGRKTTFVFELGRERFFLPDAVVESLSGGSICCPMPDKGGWLGDIGIGAIAATGLYTCVDKYPGPESPANAGLGARTLGEGTISLCIGLRGSKCPIPTI